MKKFLVAGLVLCGSQAFALGTFAKVTGDDISVSNMHDCTMQAWAATEPSEEQNAAAKAAMEGLHTFVNDRVEGIQTLGRNVLAAWVRHPVNLAEINTARAELDAAVKPVKDEITTVSVNVINLLKVGQRGKFDKAFAKCMLAD